MKGAMKRSYDEASTCIQDTCGQSSTSCEHSHASDWKSAASHDISIDFLNKRRREWLHSAQSIVSLEEAANQEFDLESDVMFMIMQRKGEQVEPTILGMSYNYVKEMEYFRDEMVGYPVSQFLSKNQPEDPLWIDCLNWNLVYKREQGRELHVAQAGALFKIGNDELIVACGTVVPKCLGQLDLTIHRKLKAIANKVLLNESFAKWATIEYKQYMKEDRVYFSHRQAPDVLENENTFLRIDKRKQSLYKMLSKSSTSCLDLCIPENNEVRVDVPKLSVEAGSYEDLLVGDAHADDCCGKYPSVRPKNIGSISHPDCKKACQFHFFSYKGCSKGFQCTYCHEGHVSNRKAKAKQWMEKQNQRAKEKAQQQMKQMQDRPQFVLQQPVHWPTGWIAPQNDAMSVGFVPIQSSPVNSPVFLAPVEHQCQSMCQNCGCHGQVQSIQQPVQTILVPHGWDRPMMMPVAPQPVYYEEYSQPPIYYEPVHEYSEYDRPVQSSEIVGW